MGCCTTKQKIQFPKDKNQFLQIPKLSQNDKNNKNAGRTQEGEQNLDKLRIDTPQATEENQKGNQIIEELAGSLSRIQIVHAVGPSGKVQSYQYFDISPKVVKKNKIYHISNQFPVSKPYSNPSEWQKLLQRLQSLTDEEVVMKILGMRNRNWIQEQIKLKIEISNQNIGSLESLVTNRRFIQMREHFNWLVWALAQFYFFQKYDNRFGLPKMNSKTWTEGFEYKGVYFRVLPYEDAYFIHNEMQALKYVQMELLELQAISPALAQQYGQPKFNSHNDIILPLMCGVSCGGFYLYGSPVIYTQELDQTKEFYNSKIQNSMVQNYNSVQMQAVANQSNISFSYLHNNISPDFIQDSFFKFMPILKNISTKNMVPIIDFEEFNDRQNEEQKYELDLKYLVVNLFGILPKLSETSASTSLMRFSCLDNEDVSFHPFPKNNFMELRDLKKLISADGSHLGDNEDFDDQQDIQSIFTKKFFTKHGWDFILMQRSGAINENKRASNIYNQREIPIKTNQKEDQNNNMMLLVDDFIAKEEGLEQQSRYISPMKQTVLKRNDSLTEEKISGNVLIAGYNYKKDFKVKYSMNNHTYSTNIETLYSATLDQITKIIEQSDTIYNSQSIKELLHRKGLNMRFEWAILTKLRLNFYREMIMIDILLRVMRKIINEEIKLKSKVSQNYMSEGGINTHDEYFRGNQLDIYKETIAFYINTILKRKYTKQKQVFDETLLGLFLSRMSILGIIFSLNLKKEEYIYLESKDILDDIMEAPSKNPMLFINAVQTYFKIEFKPDFLRITRQDKHLLLSKSQPVTPNDIKGILLNSCFPFSIREYGYFMLARQITHHSKNSPQKSVGKIKTKSDKDKMRQSFQKPQRPNDSQLNISQASHRDNGMGPLGIVNDSSTIDHNDSKTQRQNEQSQALKEMSLNTIRQYKNMDKADEFQSPPLKEARRNKTESVVQTQKKTDVLDLSRLTKRNNFQPTQVQELIMPSILYKMKTYLSSNPMYYFDDQSKTYIGDTLTILRSHYEMPNLDIVNEWVIFMESLLKDVYSVNGSEQVLLEAFVYQAILTYFFENDNEGFFKILQKIRDALFLSISCSPETVITIQILTGLFMEDQKECHPIEAEKSYLTAMICIFQLYGDPRGRGNLGIPYTLFLSWKLSLWSLAEDKKLQDSEFAEEMYDACLKSLTNHRRLYKEQQLSNNLSNVQPKGSQINMQKHISENQFEQEVERQELLKQLFDIRKYRTKQRNVTLASGGIAKSTTIHQQRKASQYQAHNVYVSHNPNLHASIPNSQVEDDLKNNIKSKSHVIVDKKKARQKNSQKDYEVEISDIDLDMNDDNINIFIQENFKNSEYFIGICPFQHWSLYRQQIAQIMQAHNNILHKNNQASQQYQKQIYRDMISKALPRDLFYQWLIKFNPIMYQSGIQWSHITLKEIVFNQNQQMVSSSGSSAILSNQGMSHQSLSSLPSSAKEKRHIHLGSYSQILGKEFGGISKSDMSGVVFTWGTDSHGQLGLDILSPNNQAQAASIKVLYPRMVVSLRDEIIKEICCGFSHTLAINIHGQVFAWGLNQSGQLGLGPDAPQIVKKPVLNQYLSNIIKLSAGNEHSIGINKNGELYIWGAGGIAGTGDFDNKTIPVKMEAFGKTKIALAVCGGLHTIAVTKDGETYSWGSCEGGQLGLPQNTIMQLCQGQQVPINVPQKIPKLEGQIVVQVACGEAHSMFQTKDGTILGCGLSNYGQLGLGFSGDSFEPGVGMEKSKIYEPQEIPGLRNENVTKIICGGVFTLFQTEKGTLLGCGMNDLGQVGLDTFMDEISVGTLERVKKGKSNMTSDVTLPTKVICFEGITLHNIASGENHSLAVSGDDRNMLWAWGKFKDGQLGLGEVQIKMNPRPVQTLCSVQIQRIACGGQHSQALIGDCQQISTLSPQYYVSNENSDNKWSCDFRGLSFKDLSDIDLLEDEVPDDGEGKIKNPK